MHLEIVRKFDKAKANSSDRKNYEEKLGIIGLNDEMIYSRLENYRATRREVVHEKAHSAAGEMRSAQTEAGLAYALMQDVRRLLENQS